jgi:periplasmic divalent cation tolerance protein
MLIAFTTTDKRSVAYKIANDLINNGLAACVQIVKIKSFYIWKGKKEKADEYLIIIKTNKKVLSKLEKRIKDLSNYGLPEFVYIKAFASKDYEKWIGELINKKTNEKTK